MSTHRVDAPAPRLEPPPAEAEPARGGGGAAAPAGAPAAGAERGARIRAAPGGRASPRAAAPGGSARARALERARATARAARPAAPAGPPPKGYAAAATGSSSGEWAFLDARGTSIEDKLFLFMKKVMEKTDKELVDRMKEYKARFTSARSTSASSQKKGTSLFDVAKMVVPALGMAEKLLGEAGIKKLVSSLGGPVLAAAATAAGLPQLAPLALRYGGDVAALAFREVGSSAAAAPSASAPSAAEPGSPDEKMAMLEIQVLVEKQQRMFAAVSGTLKAMHDAEMVAVHNIR